MEVSHHLNLEMLGRQDGLGGGEQDTHQVAEMSRAKVRRPGHVRGAGEDSSGQEEARMSVSVTSRQGALATLLCQAHLVQMPFHPSQVVCSQVGDLTSELLFPGEIKL